MAEVNFKIHEMNGQEASLECPACGEHFDIDGSWSINISEDGKVVCPRCFAVQRTTSESVSKPTSAINTLPITAESQKTRNTLHFAFFFIGLPGAIIYALHYLMN